MNLEHFFDAPKADPQAILRNRSERAARQRRMLAGGYPSLVSFTLNIPGPVKQFPMARSAFLVGLTELREAFPGAILQEQLTELDTGSEALLALSLDPRQVKEQLAAVEALHPLGRLFDMDVLDAGKTALSRAALGLPPRECLLCGQNAKLCGRSRAHSTEALQLRVAQILNAYFRGEASRRFSAYATRALLYEVSSTPKPGLVDRMNNGAHRDMDFFTFLDSSAVLSPWFGEMFVVGWDHADSPPDKLFRLLRYTGRQAERAMFQATGGVNTHKGLIFSLGLLCGAAGAVQSGCAGPISISALLARCAAIGRHAAEDFSQEEACTSGLRSYRQYRISGVRGEAAQGFPSAAGLGLGSLLRLLEDGASLNDAAAMTLLKLIAQTDDTNMIRRGGLQTAQRCREQAQSLAQTVTPENFYDVLCGLDRQYIESNLSPGGCADLLAISLLLLFLYQGGELLL